MFVFDKDGNIAFVDHEHQHSTTHLFKEMWSVKYGIEFNDESRSMNDKLKQMMSDFGNNNTEQQNHHGTNNKKYGNNQRRYNGRRQHHNRQK